MRHGKPNRLHMKRSRQAIVGGTLLLAVLGTVAGVGAMVPHISALAEQDSVYARDFSLPANSTLVVHHLNGAVTVQGWDRPDVRLEAKNPQTEGPAASSESFRMAREGNDWVVNRTEQHPLEDRNTELQLVLRVPRDVALDLNVKNGSITVVGLEAPVTLMTGNGSIVCEHLSETVRAETLNGNIECRYVLGGIEARTGNGAILVDERHVPEAQPLDLISENGSVRVVMPDEARFQLDARAQQGRVRSEFRPDRVQGLGLRRVVGTVAGGGPGVLLRALNGTVRIERG